MKKPLAILLTILTILSLTFCAGATWSHEASGITIELPAGMTGEDTSTEDTVSLYVNSEDEAAPVYHVFIEYDENYAGIWMEDLDESALEELAQYYAPEGQNAAYIVLPGTNATLLVLASEENTDAVVVALLNGWFVSVEATATEGSQLTEGAYTDVENLVASIQLPEVEAGAEAEAGDETEEAE